MYHKGGLCWCKKKWGDEYGHILSGEKLRDSEADVICAPQPIAFNFKHQRLSPWNGLWPEIGAHLDHKEQTKNARKLMFPRGRNQPSLKIPSSLALGKGVRATPLKQVLQYPHPLPHTVVTCLLSHPLVASFSFLSHLPLLAAVFWNHLSNKLLTLKSL